MAAGNHNDAADVLHERRLVLCFDGTGNKFSGKTSDTNIVKLYQMLDRRSPEQFHYYQRGSAPVLTLLDITTKLLSSWHWNVFPKTIKKFTRRLIRKAQIKYLVFV